MNQLVRGQIDLAGFAAWYESLATEGQVDLLWHLHHFAQQAGGKEDVFQAAAKAAQVSENDLLAKSAVSFRGVRSSELGIRLVDWLSKITKDERRRLLPLFVYYFGFAEGAVFERETVEWCNHWWHRDLLDPRVVEAILSNPQYFLTAMRDDIVIKSRDAQKGQA